MLSGRDDLGESRMREICMSGSTREREAAVLGLCASHSALSSLLYREVSEPVDHGPRSRLARSTSSRTKGQGPVLYQGTVESCPRTPYCKRMNKVRSRNSNGCQE